MGLPAHPKETDGSRTDQRSITCFVDSESGRSRLETSLKSIYFRKPSVQRGPGLAAPCGSHPTIRRLFSTASGVWIMSTQSQSGASRSPEEAESSGARGSRTSIEHYSVVSRRSRSDLGLFTAGPQAIHTECRDCSRIHRNEAGDLFPLRLG